jgi:starch synthase
MNVMMISFSGTITEIHYLKQLITALLSSSQVSRISLALPDYSSITGLPNSINIHKFPFSISLLKAAIKALNPFLYRRLNQRINLIRPDVVHVVFEFRVPFFLVSALHRRYPIVTTVHEPRATTHTLMRTSLLNPIQNTNANLIMRSSDKIIVHGQKHQDYLSAKRVPAHKIRVVPHSGFTFFASLGEKEVKAREGNILFFGKITPYKGIEYLIEAGNLIKQKIPGMTITIAGEGDFNRYEKMITGDSHFLVHNRFITDHEVAELFREASVVVLPYVDGSQSSIISIAGAFKKPVVATSVGNFAEMVENGNTGFIVPPKDANALAEAVIKLLNSDKLRQEMGENAYKAVRDKFSLDRIAQQTSQVYKEAIEARKS